MKKLFCTAIMLFAFTWAQAQTTRDDGQADVDDKIQQEPPREVQRRVENLAAPSMPTQQNAQAEQQAIEKRKREMERATGQSAENPAKNNTVVPQARLNEPDSKPLKTNP
jgi:Skp family chaperone for outer membrane proteins